MNILPQSFFERPADIVARDLLGCFLVRKMKNGTMAKCMITETEAYLGPHDLACHSSKGKTKRTEVMFGPAGRFYIYFVYGMHWMLNVVTGPVDFPAAVLLRGIEEKSGPARLTRFLNITGKQNGEKNSKRTGLWIESRGKDFCSYTFKIVRKPRIGVSYAGPVWSKKKLRFLLERRKTRK